MANEMNRSTGRMGTVSSSASLNPSMSRSGFIKTVGVAGASLGIGATGFAGAAKAQTPPPVSRTFTIYPVEHSQFEKKFTPTQGQTKFTLDVAGPFCASQIIYRPVDDFRAYAGQTSFQLGHVPNMLFNDPLNNCLVVFVNGEIVWNWTVNLNEHFTASAGQTQFTLSQDEAISDVRVNGESVGNYTQTNNTITFDQGLQSGDEVLVLYAKITSTLEFFTALGNGGEVRVVDNFNWYYPLVGPENGGTSHTISGKTLNWTGPMLRPRDIFIVQAIFAPERFTATSGQTAFNLTNASKNSGFVSVLVDGEQKTSGFTLTSNTLKFNSGLAQNSKVVVVYGDHDLIQEAINNAVDGDRIALSDTNTAGVAKKWAMARLLGVGSDRVANVTTPSGTYDFNLAQADGALRNSQAYHHLMISKGITICKKASGNKPILSQYLTDMEWNEVVPFIDLANPFSLIIVHGNVSASASKRPKFENLKIERWYVGILGVSPFIFDKCDFDKLSECIMPLVDNRMTFPYLSKDGRNFSDMLTTEVTSCSFKNVRWATINAACSGLVYAHNTVTSYLGFFSVVQVNSANGPGWGTLANAFFGLPEESTMQKFNCFNLVLDNDIIGTDAPNGAQMVVLSGETVGAGAESFNNSINGNRFTDWNTIQTAEAGFSFGGGKAYNNEISGNVFTRCSGCAVVDSVLGDEPADTVTDARISGNKFIRCDLAVSQYWPNTDGTPSGGPAVHLGNARHVIVSDNDYTESGLLPSAEAVDDTDVPIMMMWSDNCSVSEKQTSFPDPSLPVSAWVIDENGFQNWIDKNATPQGWFKSGGLHQKRLAQRLPFLKSSQIRFLHPRRPE